MEFTAVFELSPRLSHNGRGRRHWVLGSQPLDRYFRVELEVHAGDDVEAQRVFGTGDDLSGDGAVDDHGQTKRVAVFRLHAADADQRPGNG